MISPLVFLIGCSYSNFTMCLLSGRSANVTGSLMKRDPSEVIKEAIKPFLDLLSKDSNIDPKTERDVPKKDPQGNVHPPDPFDRHHLGWELLKRADSMSTRQFLRS